MAAHALDQLAAEVTILANLLRKNTAAIQAIPPGALDILRLLSAHGELTVPALGRLRVTSRQNIQIAVNRLRAAGFVDYTSNPSHKRSLLVRLTPSGAALVNSAEQRDDEYRREMASRISEQQALQTVEFLQRLRRMLTQESKAIPTRKPRPVIKVRPTPPPEELAGLEEFPVNLL